MVDPTLGTVIGQAGTDAATAAAADPGFFRSGFDFLKNIPGAVTDTAALEAGVGNVLDSRSGMIMLPMMGEVATSIAEDERRRAGESYDDYMDRLAAVRAERRRRYGSNPYAGLYSGVARGYARGGQVGPGMDYNRFAVGGPIPYTGTNPIMMASSSDPYGEYDPRQGEEGGYGPPSYGGERDPRDNERILPGDGSPSQNPNDAGTSRQSMAWTPLQSFFGPAGYMPGFMPERMYMGPEGTNPVDPRTGEEYTNEYQGQIPNAQGNPFTFNPFGSGGFQNPFGRQFGGGMGGYGGFGGPFGGFSPFGGPQFSPFRGFNPYGGGMMGGGIMGGFGGFNPYARRSPWGFAQGGEVPAANPMGGLGDGIAAAIVAPDGSAEPAMLSPGEYVIPADVVSMIGDGDTDAGSDQLDQMLARIRVEKTGSPEQLPPMNPNALVG
jgi:hypothetical protein